ncbi:MAG: hypothetical protein ABTQ25_13490 [Nitrosomonas ureae]
MLLTFRELIAPDGMSVGSDPENGKKNDLERFSTPENALVELLKEQLQNAKEHENQAREREQQALEREREGWEREVRLLALLEAEQQARCDLEQKLLPPLPPPHRHHRLGWLLAILALAIAALVWTRTSAYWPLGA